jgi:hypothetical protein
LLVIRRLLLLRKKDPENEVDPIPSQVGRQLPVHITHFIGGAGGAPRSSKRRVPMNQVHVGSRSVNSQPTRIGLQIAKSDHGYDA